MTEIELGLYHYRFIYQISDYLSKELDLNILINHIFGKINLEIRPNYSVVLKKEDVNLKTYLKFGNLNKIEDINWEYDDIVKYVSDHLIPIKIDSIINEKNIKISKSILSAIGIKINSTIAFPIFFENQLLFIFLFFNETKTFTEHEFEMLKRVFKILNDHISLLKLKECSEEKCKYFSMILDSLSSGIIIYSDNEIKFINKKASEIFEIEKNEQIPQEILNIILESIQQKTSKTRQEISVKIGKEKKVKIIGYSITYTEKIMTPTLIMILQDITNLTNKNQNSAYPGTRG